MDLAHQLEFVGRVRSSYTHLFLYWYEHVPRFFSRRVDLDFSKFTFSGWKIDQICLNGFFGLLGIMEPFLLPAVAFLLSLFGLLARRWRKTRTTQNTITLNRNHIELYLLEQFRSSYIGFLRSGFIKDGLEHFVHEFVNLPRHHPNFRISLGASVVSGLDERLKNFNLFYDNIEQLVGRNIKDDPRFRHELSEFLNLTEIFSNQKNLLIRFLRFFIERLTTFVVSIRRIFRISGFTNHDNHNKK